MKNEGGGTEYLVWLEMQERTYNGSLQSLRDKYRRVPNEFY